MSPTFVAAKLVVADIEASAAFYKSAFEFSEEERISAIFGGRNLTEIILRTSTGETVPLMLFVYHDDPPPPPGETIMTFRTDDIDSLVERVLAAGGSIMEPIQDLPEFNFRVAFVRDNEGHVIEVVEPLEAA